MEAKTFVLSVMEGASVLQVEERRGYSAVAFLGTQCTAWLISTVEELMQSPGAKNFVKSFREGSKATIVRRGGNSFGRFLEVAVYAMGGRQGLVLIPEGWEGWGWWQFAVELGKATMFFKASVGVGFGSSSPVKKKLGKEDGSGTGVGLDHLRRHLRRC